MKLPIHLGGHANITHVDEGALIYLKSIFNIISMIDVGCGIGGVIPLAMKHNIVITGVDGDFEAKRSEIIKEHVIIHDYTTGKLDLAYDQVDLCWSVEFLEHVEEKFLPNVFDTFKMAKYIFCTANPYRNKYHFNPQPTEYWIKKFEENGFEFLKKETEEVKAVSTMNRNFVRDTGMIFKNKTL